MNVRSFFIIGALLALSVAVRAGARPSQEVREGSPVSPTHRAMYVRGLQFLVDHQQPSGSFDGDAGVTAICVMALLASGEDPNYGRYAGAVRRGVGSLLEAQNARTGQIGSGMYQHGFGLLCLAEAYGAVDDRLLKEEFPDLGRTVGEAVELAVSCAVTSQGENPFNAWRYTRKSIDADSSVAGAVMMGLLGARNAGLSVPDDAIEKGLIYLSDMTSSEGEVAYSGVGGAESSEARTAIVATVFAVAKRRETDTFLAVERGALEKARRGPGPDDSRHPCYTRYYVSQALFQVDHGAWKAWSTENSKDLMRRQASDGSFRMPEATRQGCYPTGMLLLSAALEFSFLPIYER